MSRSHLVVRGVFVAASAAMAVLTMAASSPPLYVAVLALLVLTGFAVRQPDSHLVTALVGGHALHWVAVVAVPTRFSSWVLLLCTALLGLVVHLAAGLAAAYPPQAPLPRLALTRWGGRAAVVVLLTLPVWGVVALTTSQNRPGEVALTFAAITAAALLGLGVLLGTRDPGAQS